MRKAEGGKKGKKAEVGMRKLEKKEEDQGQRIKASGNGAEENEATRLELSRLADIHKFF